MEEFFDSIPHPYMKFEDCPNPPEWLHELAIEKVKLLLLEGNLTDFYESWSEFAKNNFPFVEFSKKIVGFETNYGTTTSVDEAYGAKIHAQNSEVIITFVSTHIDDIRFWACVGFNSNKEICDFQLGRCRIYHTPNYIKESRFERITLSEDPLIVLSRPTKAGDKYPCVFMINSQWHLGIDGRMGYCDLYKDYEYLPGANIAFIRGEYTEQMLDFPEPPAAYSAALMQQIMARSDITDIYAIFQGYGVLWMNRIIRKFGGMIKGAIIINPPSKKIEGFPGMENYDFSKFPEDIPVLLLHSELDQLIPDEDKIEWLDFAATKKNITVRKYDKCDHMLMSCETLLDKIDYGVNERHLSDVALRDIALFIRK